MSDGMTDFYRMVAKCKDYDRIVKELESDDWMKHATEFYENGGCPICFSTDEAGCTSGCYLGQIKASHTKLRAAADEGLRECERVKMHCTCYKDLGSLLARIERIEQTIAEAEKLRNTK